MNLGPHLELMFGNKKNSIKMLWSHLEHILPPNKRHNKSNSFNRLLIDGKEVKDDNEIT